MLRPRLSLAEYRFLVLATSFSVALALLEVMQVSSVTAQSYPLQVINFDGCFSIVQLICYLVVMFATTVNLQLIASTLADGPMTYAAAVLYHKQQAYMNFRRLFMVLVFKLSILLSLQIMILAHAEWVVELLRQASTLLIYVVFFGILCPSKLHIVELLRPQAVAAGSILSFTPSNYSDSGEEEEDAETPRAGPLEPLDSSAGSADTTVFYIEDGDLAPSGGLLTDISAGEVAISSNEEDVTDHYIPLAGGESD